MTKLKAILVSLGLTDNEVNIYLIKKIHNFVKRLLEYLIQKNKRIHIFTIYFFYRTIVTLKMIHFFLLKKSKI